MFSLFIYIYMLPILLSKESLGCLSFQVLFFSYLSVLVSALLKKGQPSQIFPANLPQISSLPIYLFLFSSLFQPLLPDARQNTSTWKDMGQKILLLIQYMWPKKNYPLQGMVIFCLMLMGIERAINVFVPIYYKHIGKKNGRLAGGHSAASRAGMIKLLVKQELHLMMCGKV